MKDMRENRDLSLSLSSLSPSPPLPLPRQGLLGLLGLLALIPLLLCLVLVCALLWLLCLRMSKSKKNKDDLIQATYGSAACPPMVLPLADAAPTAPMPFATTSQLESAVVGSYSSTKFPYLGGGSVSGKRVLSVYGPKRTAYMNI